MRERSLAKKRQSYEELLPNKKKLPEYRGYKIIGALFLAFLLLCFFIYFISLSKGKPTQEKIHFTKIVQAADTKDDDGTMEEKEDEGNVENKVEETSARLVEESKINVKSHQMREEKIKKLGEIFDEHKERRKLVEELLKKSVSSREKPSSISKQNYRNKFALLEEGLKDPHLMARVEKERKKYKEEVEKKLKEMEL